MANSAEISRQRFWRQLKEDLAPFPGRMAQTWRMALVCALTCMMSMVYGIPEAAISCYLVFFVMKPDAAESVLLALSMCFLTMGVISLLFLLTRWTIQVPPMRILAIALTSLVFLYLASASKLGALGGIIALILAFGLTLLSDVPFGELATRGILFAWLMGVMPMLWIAIVSLTIGRKPLPLLRQTVSERLEIIADWLERATPENRARLRDQIWEGQEDHMKRWGITRLFALARRDESRRLGVALQDSYRLAFIMLAQDPDAHPEARQAIAQQARIAARALAAGEPVPAPEGELPADASAPLVQGWHALLAMVGTPDHPLATAPAESFMRPDARSNPEHLRYAIKTTAAAIICYCTYTALDWQGIHTAMITCYVIALGSVAETTHKLILRITGCLIGAALGVGSILFLIPHMTSIGAVMLLVFCGTFIAAWVAVGSDRVSYAGVQIALAFLLTVLSGYGPSTDMDAALDRIIGVLLGNFVVYFMFTQFWPVSVAQRVWDNTSRALSGLARMACMPRPGQPAEQEHSAMLAEAASMATKVADTRYSLELAGYEPNSLRLSSTEIRRLAKTSQAMRNACLDMLLQPSADPALGERLETLSKQAADIALQRPELPLPPPGAAPGEARSLERNVQRLETLINGR